MNNPKKREQMDIEKIGKELAKGIKIQSDLKKMTRELMKVGLESVLNAELDSHLGL